MRNMQAYLLKEYRGLIVAFVAVSLAGCGKSIAFLEQAEVTGYAKTPVTLERKQFYEKRNNQLRWIDVFVRAEMRILDTQLPIWRGDLHPVFLGYQKELGFVLVTSIRDSITCVKRGRPKSSYVAFVVSGDQWVEIDVPLQFDKARANLLLGPSPSADYSVEKPLTMMDKEFSNRHYGLGTGFDVINIGKPYGC